MVRYNYNLVSLVCAKKKKESIFFIKFRIRYIKIIFLLVFFIINISAYSQNKLDSVIQEEGFTYAISLPVNFKKENKYLLGICLHGLYGSGKYMAKDFSIYSRYMNMILVCPNGNIPDPSRYATKWGSEDSVEYILTFLDYIKRKYNVYDNHLLIGFSQGANQAFYMALRDPEIWKTVAVLSGGYSEIPVDNHPNITKIKLLFISGDTGPGEVYTLRRMNEKIALFSQFTKINQTIIKGHIHETSPIFAYNIFKWYIKDNPIFKKSFWMNKGDFYGEYSKGEEEFQKGNYSKSISYFNSSLKLNPVYPLTHSRYAHASLLSGKLKFFKRSFYNSMEIHTNDPTISRKNIPQLFEDLRITLKNDDKLRKYFIHYLESNLREYEPMISGIFSAEINLLLAYLHKYSDDPEESKRALENAKTLFLSIEDGSSDYLDFQVQKKIEITENF
jgi:tetratricopeptide (TPR) repeat protein